MPHALPTSPARLSWAVCLLLLVQMAGSAQPTYMLADPGMPVTLVKRHQKSLSPLSTVSSEGVRNLPKVITWEGPGSAGPSPALMAYELLVTQ